MIRPVAMLPPVLRKASWAVGGLGTTSMLYLINMFVVFFLVRHVGVPAAVAGALLAVTRVYDSILNPLIGAWSDRSRSRWGRRKPWMLAGALLAPLGCIAVFSPPALPPGALLYAAILAALFLYCTAYSLFSIPHVALGAELTDDYAERASLMAWRTFFVYLSGIVITAGAPALVARLGADRRAYTEMSYAAATVILATMLWVVGFSGAGHPVRRSAQPFAPFRALRAAFANTPFLMILLTKMSGQLGTAFSGASMLFFIAEVMQRNEAALALFGLITNVVGVGIVPVWNAVLRRIERRVLLRLLLAVNALASLSWLLAGPGESDVVFAIRACLLGACGSGSVLVAMAMVADTIELDRYTSGERREGLYVGAFELMQTTSFIVAPLLAGAAFSVAGLVPGHVAPGAQPPAAIAMIRIAMSILPAACSTAGVVLTFLYRLDAARLATLRAAASPASGPQASPPLPSTMNASASLAVRTGSSSTSM